MLGVRRLWIVLRGLVPQIELCVWVGPMKMPWIIPRNLARSVTVGLFIALFSSDAFGETRIQNQKAFSHTSICQLFNTPEAYSTKKVRIHGYIVGGFHGIAVFNRKCEGRGIFLSILNEVAEQGEASIMMNVIYKKGIAGTGGKIISSDIVGTFVYNANSRPDMQIYVDYIENLHWRIVKAR